MDGHQNLMEVLLHVVRYMLKIFPEISMFLK